METDVQFYSRRVAEECRATERALTEEARALHRALADSYAAKLRELGPASDAEPARWRNAEVSVPAFETHHR